MKKKRIISVILAGILTSLSCTVVYAMDYSSEINIQKSGQKDELLFSKDSMEKTQLISTDIKGHWLMAEVESWAAADFDSNGDCRITMNQQGEDSVLCVQPDGAVKAEGTDLGDLTEFSVFRSGDIIFYYTYEENSCLGLVFLDGEQSERVYIVEVETELFFSEEKMISIDEQKVYDYEIIDTTVCLFNEEEVQGLELQFFKPELFVCSDIRESRNNLGMDSLVVFIKADSLEKE